MLCVDGTGLVQGSLTGVNCRPLSQFAKEADAVERVRATVGCRDVPVMVQAADFVVHIHEQMKASVKCCEEFLLN